MFRNLSVTVFFSIISIWNLGTGTHQLMHQYNFRIDQLTIESIEILFDKPYI